MGGPVPGNLSSNVGDSRRATVELSTHRTRRSVRRLPRGEWGRPWVFDEGQLQ